MRSSQQVVNAKKVHSNMYEWQRVNMIPW